MSALLKGAEPDGAGMWCANNSAICPSVWWCSPGHFAVTTALGVMVWGGLFLTLMFAVYPVLERRIERIPSTLDNEKGAAWFAWHVQSVIHSTFVSLMAAGVVRNLASAPAFAQFDAPSLAFPAWAADVAVVANVSHVFLCFLLVDTIVVFARRDMTLDYFIHHMIFGSFSLMLQYDCFCGYLAGWLLLMEVSTIFLNGFSFFRHRLGYGHFIVKGFFGAFAVTFMVFRLGGTMYISIHYSRVLFSRRVPFEGIPVWRLYTICGAMLAAVLLQLYWACSIGKKLAKVLTNPEKTAEPLLPPPDTSSTSSSEPTTSS